MSDSNPELKPNVESGNTPRSTTPKQSQPQEQKNSTSNKDTSSTSTFSTSTTIAPSVSSTSNLDSKPNQTSPPTSNNNNNVPSSGNENSTLTSLGSTTTRGGHSPNPSSPRNSRSKRNNASSSSSSPSPSSPSRSSSRGSGFVKSPSMRGNGNGTGTDKASSLATAGESSQSNPDSSDPKKTQGESEPANVSDKEGGGSNSHQTSTQSRRGGFGKFSGGGGGGKGGFGNRTENNTDGGESIPRGKRSDRKGNRSDSATTAAAAVTAGDVSTSTSTSTTDSPSAQSTDASKSKDDTHQSAPKSNITSSESTGGDAQSSQPSDSRNPKDFKKNKPPRRGLSERNSDVRTDNFPTKGASSSVDNNGQGNEASDSGSFDKKRKPGKFNKKRDDDNASIASSNSTKDPDTSTEFNPRPKAAQRNRDKASDNNKPDDSTTGESSSSTWSAKPKGNRPPIQQGQQQQQRQRPPYDSSSDRGSNPRFNSQGPYNPRHSSESGGPRYNRNSDNSYSGNKGYRNQNTNFDDHRPREKSKYSESRSKNAASEYDGNQSELKPEWEEPPKLEHLSGWGEPMNVQAGSGWGEPPKTVTGDGWGDPPKTDTNNNNWGNSSNTKVESASSTGGWGELPKTAHDDTWGKPKPATGGKNQKEFPPKKAQQNNWKSKSATDGGESAKTSTESGQRESKKTDESSFNKSTPTTTESGWGAPPKATAEEKGWGAPLKATTEEKGWGAPEAAAAESGWGEPPKTTTEDNWSNPAPTASESGWDAPDKSSSAKSGSNWDEKPSSSDATGSGWGETTTTGLKWGEELPWESQHAIKPLSTPERTSGGGGGGGRYERSNDSGPRKYHEANPRIGGSGRGKPLGDSNSRFENSQQNFQRGGRRYQGSDSDPPHDARSSLDARNTRINQQRGPRDGPNRSFADNRSASGSDMGSTRSGAESEQTESFHAKKEGRFDSSSRRDTSYESRRFTSDVRQDPRYNSKPNEPRPGQKTGPFSKPFRQEQESRSSNPDTHQNGLPIKTKYEQRERKGPKERDPKEKVEQGSLFSDSLECQMTWKEMDLSPNVLASISKAGLDKPSNIQKLVVKPFEQGLDIIAQSQSQADRTNTLAMLLQQKLTPTASTQKQCQALVICSEGVNPQKVHEDFESWFKETPGLQSVLLSAKMVADRTLLEDPEQPKQVVLTTLGPLTEAIKNGLLDMKTVNTIAVSMQSVELVGLEAFKRFWTTLSPGTQKVLITGKIQPQIQKIRNLHFGPNTAVRRADELTMQWSEHYHIPFSSPEDKQESQQDAEADGESDGAPMDRRWETLIEILSKNPDISHALILTQSQSVTQALTTRLGAQKLPVLSMWSMADKAEVARQFNKPDPCILVSESVLMDNFDLDYSSLVINYEMPKKAMHYISSFGPFGRSGLRTLMINFCTVDDAYQMQTLANMESLYDIKIKEMQL